MGKPEKAKTKYNSRRPAPVQKQSGRPYVIQDEKAAIKLLAQLGQLKCTLKECAAMLKVTQQTLSNFFERVPEAKESYERGLQVGNISLRRSQFRLAEKSASMNMFLGVNYLGQTDTRHMQVQGSIEHQHTLISKLFEDADRAERADEQRTLDLIANQTNEEPL